MKARECLCSPTHLPEASQCSYCDLLASKCIIFSVCCSSDSRQATSAGPWAHWWLLQRLRFFWEEIFMLHLFSRNSSSMSSSQCIETCAQRMKMRRKWDEITYLQQFSKQVFFRKKCRSQSKKLQKETNIKQIKLPLC